VLRIFPLYYATLGLLAATAIVQSIRHSKFPGALFFHNQIILWSYTQNIAYALQGWRQLAFPLPVHISHFWSLAVEEQFYLFWPFVIYFAGRRAGLIISLALIFAAAALRVALLTSWHNETAAYVLLPCRMDALAMGASLSLWVSGGVSPRRISRVAIFILALCFPIMAAYVAFNSAEGLEYQLWVQTLGFTLIAATSAAIIALCILKESVAAKLASLAALRFLGKYSYGIYVIHFLILDRIVTSLAGRLGALGIPYWMAGTSALCIYYSGVVFAAYLSWNLFEKHFIRMKRYFEPGPDDASSNRVFASGSAGFVDHD
jgi:peptidoglycan/LPS O-acetylase OafA/YrhL